MVVAGSGFSVGFVGREAQLAATGEAVRAAGSGRPSVIWVEGVAGSGKTTLVRQVLAGLPEEFVVVRAQCDELAKDIGYQLAQEFGVSSTDSPFAVAQQLLDRWSQLQERGPVVVLIEDVHWADAPSAAALSSAVRRLDQDRMLFLLTGRPGSGPEWERLRLDEERCTVVTVGSFDASEVGRLAAAQGIELTVPEATRLWSHTGGHPIWVRTLLAELTAAELKAPDGELPAPRSLASAVTTRLGSLPSDARDLAAALAVLNQRTTLPVLGRVAGIAAPLEALESVLATGYVRWEPSQPGPPVEFAHPLYRHAVYEDLSPTRRRDLHRSAARVLTPGTVLAHRVAAADGADDGLADELEAVAVTARAEGATVQAARTLLWAASLTGSSQESERRLMQAALAFLDSGQTSRAAALREQIQGFGSSPLRWLVLGLIDWELGDAAGALRWLQEAVSPPAEASDASSVSRAWAQLAEVQVVAGRAQEASVAAGKAVALADRNSTAAHIAWIHVAMAEAMLRGGPAGLRKLAERLPEQPEAIALNEIDLLVTRASIAYYSARRAPARADLDVVLELARRGHPAVQLARCHYLMGSILTSAGEWDDAELHLRTGLSISTDDRLVWMQSQCHAALATLLAYRGAWDEAQSALERAQDLALGSDNVEAAALVHIARAAVARARNEAGEVIAALEGLASVVPMLSALYFWPVLIGALIDDGQLARAREDLNAFAGAARARELDIGHSAVGLQARLAAAAQEGDEAAELFERALDPPGGYESFLDVALLHHDYAKLLLAKGNRRLATQHFRSARDMLSSVKAAPFLDRVDADLGDARLLAAQRTGTKPAFELNRPRA